MKAWNLTKSLSAEFRAGGGRECARSADCAPRLFADVRLRDVPSHAERAGLTRFLPELREAVAAGDDSDAASEVSSDDATGAAGAGGCGAACTGGLSAPAASPSSFACVLLLLFDAMTRAHEMRSY